jgi:hypothetical protein
MRLSAALGAVAVLLLAAGSAEAKPAGKKKPPAAVKKPPAAPATVGSLEVLVSSAGARVVLDNVEVGETPIKKLEGLKPGQHIIKVSKPGYSEYIETIEVKAGETASAMVDLLALSGVVYVEAKSGGQTVQNASVFVDNKPAGTAPIAGREVVPGEHTIRVVADGYKDWETTLKAAAGEEFRVKATLIATGKLAARPTAVPIAEQARKDAEADQGPKPWYSWKKPWIWVIAGGVVLAAAGTTVAVASANSGSGQPTPDQICQQAGVKCDATLQGIRF